MLKKELIYEGLNEWQKNRYSFMSNYNDANKIYDYSSSRNNGKTYAHLLTPKDKLFNFLDEQEILDEVEQRFKHHKAGNLNRVLTNTLSSQTCCFNLFTPLKNRLELANKVFSAMLHKPVLIKHIEIEFTPNTPPRQNLQNLPGFECTVDESIGDQSLQVGTDADVAIFYTYDTTKRGVILIECKYIEHKFSTCSSYENKKDIRSICDCASFYNTHIRNNLNQPTKNFDCGYLKYENWQLTRDSMVFSNDNIATNDYCPFRFSLHQLWRNLLLTEKVAKSRNLDEFNFWVLSPVENIYLWQHKTPDVEAELRKYLTPFGNSIFKRKQLAEMVEIIKKVADESWTKRWIEKFVRRYLTETTGSGITIA